MAKSMTPSKMTDGQLDKTVDIFRSVLRKHRAELGSDAVQRVLSTDEFSNEIVAMLRKRVEAVSGLIIRVWEVNLTRSRMSAIKATGRMMHVVEDVVNGMPQGEGGETEVVFFKLGRYVSDDELDNEYELRGLKPADPHSLAAVNEAEPAFADEHPNGTHWKDSKGRWCFATFYRWHDKCWVNVRRASGVGGWDDRWWYAGVRK